MLMLFSCASLAAGIAWGVVCMSTFVFSKDDKDTEPQLSISIFQSSISKPSLEICLEERKEERIMTPRAA